MTAKPGHACNGSSTLKPRDLRALKVLDRPRASLMLSRPGLDDANAIENGAPVATEDRKAECRVHGNQTAAVVCQHLVAGEGKGVCIGSAPDNPLALYPDAWCDECDRRLVAAGGWTQRALEAADLRALCSGCYMEVCARNWLEDGAAYQALVGACVGRLQSAQVALSEKFGLNRWERWHWDMEKQELAFSHAGRKRVVASVAFVGTYSTRSATWMWAWGNDSLPAHVRATLGKVKSAGEETGFRRLTLGHWAGDEHDGWHMTAYAYDVLGGLGAYRAPSSVGHVYMVIRNAKRLQ